MNITVTIQCRACGVEEKTVNAELTWLKYPVPCVIEGECSYCHSEDSLYLVELIGESVNLLHQEVSVSFTAPLTPLAKTLLEKWLLPFPLSCPACGWNHPSEMFKLGSEGFSCMKCGYVLKDSDMWHDTIGE